MLTLAPVTQPQRCRFVKLSFYKKPQAAMMQKKQSRERVDAHETQPDNEARQSN